MTDWHSRWESNKIGWHADQVNQNLIDYFSKLNLVDGDKIFVPLCGKSVDMFFSENKLEYSVAKVDDLILYEGDGIQIFCGDFFTLKANHLVDVKAVYDRASLIALDKALRQKYVNHLNDIILKDVRVLLLTLNYPQHQWVGPPYAVSKLEVDSLYGGSFQCQELQNISDIENEPMFLLQGVDFVEKAVYCLQKVRM